MAPPARAFTAYRKRDRACDVLHVLLLAVAFFSLLSVVRFSRIRTAKGLARRLGVDGLLGFPPRSDARVRAAAVAAQERELYGDTAVITLATGDAAAKHAVVLVQALRDTNTVIPRIIVLMSRGGMGSEDCHNETLRVTRSRHYHCSSRHVVEDDIISQRYIDALTRLGAELRIIDEIPNTQYTSMIPGGRATFWGMSFNKLRIFGMTEFRKILFIDADVLILRNIDHIMLEPDFTGAFTTECCNGGARGKLGGGMWVFEPSAARWNYTMELIKQPCPDSELGTWVHADMDVVNYMFCDIREGESFESWPFTRDLRQGHLPGLKYIPQYRDISEADYNRLIGFPSSGLPAPEGLLPVHANVRRGGARACLHAVLTSRAPFPSPPLHSPVPTRVRRSAAFGTCSTRALTASWATASARSRATCTTWPSRSTFRAWPFFQSRGIFRQTGSAYARASLKAARARRPPTAAPAPLPLPPAAL
jgi:hypothetical protein